jgi:hypothetical protein
VSGEDGLDEALDEVYASDLDEFVGARNALVKRLREQRKRDEAEQVAKLRKPSVAAWVLNQLARRNRREVDLLLDAGHRLREAQAGILGGAGNAAFEKARRQEADALKRLTHEAEQLLRERGSGGGKLLGQIDESLRAAAISPTGRELLARGRFHQASRAEGFEIVTEIAGASGTRGDRRQPGIQSKSRAKRRDARAAVTRAKATLREQQRDEREARQRAERLANEAEKADRAAADASSRVQAAREGLRAAEERAKQYE